MSPFLSAAATTDPAAVPTGGPGVDDEDDEGEGGDD
jgi:hypothetical protein